MKLLESIDKFSETSRVAVKCLDKQLTYKQLKEYSDKIAMYLLKEFKEDRRPIIVYGNKENNILPVMIGALKSGRAYVPLDVTFPEARIKQIIDEVKEIFLGMGYKIADGPEVEKAIYNFDKLNTPPDHPARDIQDTFYVTEDIVLRSQTSPVQARVMETQKPPIKIICPGTVYRSDSVDATHSPVFHQIEGLVIDKNISMTDLKGTLEMFAKKCLGENTKIRFRPHHFPFTEPSAEADVSCFVCGGKGCKVCKGEGWIELLGCGMVHPNVLTNCGIDPEVYSGFAFGFGVERIAMAKFGIDDMRLLFENDIRFLKQF